MKRRTAWITGGAALAVVLAAGAVWFLLPRSGSAEEQALLYLQAVERGDVTAVEAAGVEVPEEVASAFATASDHISRVAVVSSTETDSSTTVHATYVLAGEQREAEITMIEQAGRWTPVAESAFGVVKVDAPAEIGEATLAADTAIQLLPAAYDVTSSPSAFLDGNMPIQVAPGSAQEVELKTTLRTEATSLAQEQLDDYLADCTQDAAEVPPSCGIALPWAADFSDLSNISYRIEKAPALSLTPTSFSTDDGVLVATVTGTSHDGSASTLSYRTSNWTLRGDVSFTADDIVLSVW
ncbi:MAG TPA: hypothetical protein DIW46_10965 [Microbacterium sp.]|uniref:hypothetical protein n=1 Tax=Microbacterium sp. TaxID=51671 RepID=UPI000ECC0EF5|nr:hypothetical protein [Microbacterium sp.]